MSDLSSPTSLSPVRRLRQALASSALATLLALAPLPAAFAATAPQATPAPAIVLISPAAGATIDVAGTTLKGKVTNPAGVVSLTAQTTSNPQSARAIEVNPTTGEFVYRLFAADMTAGRAVTVSLTLATANGSSSKTFTFNPAANLAGNALGLAMSRLSFGWTPQLQAQVQSQGFTNWVKAQLAPTASESLIGHEPWATLQHELLTHVSVGWGNPNGTLSTPEFFINTYANMMFTASYTDWQLREKLAAFWVNHFYALPTNSAAFYGVGRYDDINRYRKLALGSFHDLLYASAQNGVMMQFLDNAQNTKWGRNENYARELMELHTVSSLAGYGDADITAVARILTGWSSKTYSDPEFTIYSPYVANNVNDIAFSFNWGNHDVGDKTVPFLNLTIKGQSGPNGVQEGEQLLDILANHPMTKQHICKELVQYLVADTPPQSAVDRCVRAWGSTGVVANLVQAIVLDPSYLTSVQVNGKAKTPFEYAVAFVRNFGVTPISTAPEQLFDRLFQAAQTAGMDFFTFFLPTGFANDTQTWLGQPGMMARINMVGRMLYYAGGEENIDYGNIPGLTTRIAATATSPSTSVAAAATAEEAAAGLLGYIDGNRYTRSEYDAMVATLRAPKGGYANASDLLARAEKAVRLAIALPSYLLK